MPLTKLQFRPGINRDITSYSNEGGWRDGDKIRFRLGYPEKIGGWQKFSESTYLGAARALHNWIALDGSNLLGVGTHLKYYIEEGTSFSDITPVRQTTAAGDITFAATNDSSTITVTDTSHGCQQNDFVTYSGAVSLGGNVTAAILNAEHQVLRVVDADTYEITVSVTASTTGVATTTVAGTSTGTATFTGITQDATSGSGTGAEFTISSDGAGNYTVDAITAIGINYAATDTITILGTQLGGATTANDLTITVASIGGDSGNGGSSTVGEYQINVGLNTTVGGTGWGAGLYGGTTTGALQTTLNEGSTLTASDTTITLTSTTGIVASDVVLIGNELILVGGISSNDLTGCTRGHSGTTATTHADGSTVRLALGNADPADDFFGWGNAASGGLTTTTQIRLWSHDNFGEDLLINPRDSNIFYWDKSSGTGARAVELSTLAGTKTSVPTVCKQVMVSDRDRHVLAFGCDAINSSSSAAQGDGTQDPLLIRFSDQEDPLVWYPAATNTAGDLRLGSGSTFVKALETKREILVWTDTALSSLRFIGPPFTFGLQQLANNITIIGPNAAVATEDFVFWMGLDNFYVYAGQTAQLPCTVKDKVFADINLAEFDKVYGAVNSEFGEVMWLYPSADSSENNRYVVYNYIEKLWYFGTLDRTAWLDRGTRDFPIAAEGGYLYNHEFGYDDDGQPMNSFIESAAIDIGDGDHFTYMRRVIPDLTFTGSTAISSPQATFTVKARNFPGEDFGNTAAGTASRTSISPVEEFTNQLDLRIRGRSFALRVESDALSSKWKLGSPRVDIRQDGRR